MIPEHGCMSLKRYKGLDGRWLNRRPEPGFRLRKAALNPYDLSIGEAMYKRNQAESEWGFIGDILKIALGVFIGCMAAVFTYEGVLAWRIEQAMRKINAELNAQEVQQKQAQELRLQQQKERQDQQRKQDLEKDWQRQQLVLAQRRKEQAWAAYFQPTNVCRMDPSRGDCADLHIRARKAFELQYRD